MSDTLLIALPLLTSAAIIAMLRALPSRATRAPAALQRDRRQSTAGVGIGTVRGIDGPITVDVTSISGQHFVGRLHLCGDDASLTTLRPGVVLLVTFDPAERERLSLADDMAAVRSAFDQMLLAKGLVTREQLSLIRDGIKSHAIVTAMRATGAAREDYREVEIDLMVRRPAGGQFPARETALVPESALGGVTPGCVVDTYYRAGDESSVAVCVPPG